MNMPPVQGLGPHPNHLGPMFTGNQPGPRQPGAFPPMGGPPPPGGFPPRMPHSMGGGGGPRPQMASTGQPAQPAANCNSAGDEGPKYERGNTIRNRDVMYRMVISQLFYDGLTPIAVQLTNALGADPPCPPSDRLFHVLENGLESEAREKAEEEKANKRSVLAEFGGPMTRTELWAALQSKGLDLEFDTEPTVLGTDEAPEPATYETAYVTSHKSNCRAGDFSPDGSLVATGSHDTSIKILDVDRMLAKSSMESTAAGNKNVDPGSHPVIRTLYDHFEEVTCLKFHPREPLLASGARDHTVKIFDYGKASAKKAFKTINENCHVEALAFHPSGSHLLVGVEQPVIRMYDVNTTQCYVGSVPSHQHRGPITSLDWSLDGKSYVSASIDGSIKVWDGISSHCVATFTKAHDGAEVSSVKFTHNGKYVLSSGKDSLIKLWELTTSRCLIAYTGAGATGKQEFHAQAVMNHTEDYVMFPDEATTSLCCWDSRNASRKQLLSLGHNGAVRFIVHSPTEAAFLTCSDDHRARFWFKRNA